MRSNVLAALIAAAASSASAQGSFWIESSWSCAAWAEARKDQQAQLIEQQLVGTLNGFALATGRDFWQTGGTIDSQQAFFWMDQYCAKNPLDHLIMGAAALATERLGKGWNLLGSGQ